MPAALQFKPRTPVRIFVVDDSPMVRRVLRGLLERHDNWKVCGEASTGSEAVRNVDRVNPDVVILDFQMPEMNGLDAAKTMTSQSPDLPILMVSTYMSPELAQEARKAGVRGACGKQDITCVVEAVDHLLQNQTYFRA
jgi:DNA-binding NarL/FixJ family response regulator